MRKLTSLFAAFILVASTFLVACGDNYRTAYEYEEYDEPCYANQQPNYVDGDYYIFNCGDRYRRVRRNRIVYVDNPVYIPVLTDYERNRVYDTMPRTTRRKESGVTRSTGVNSPPSTSQPSTTGSGVTRSTSTSRPPTTAPQRSTSTTSPTRSTSSSPTRSTSTSSSSSSRSTSTSGVSRSTSSKRP